MKNINHPKFIISQFLTFDTVQHLQEATTTHNNLFIIYLQNTVFLGMIEYFSYVYIT